MTPDGTGIVWDDAPATNAAAPASPTLKKPSMTSTDIQWDDAAGASSSPAAKPVGAPTIKDPRSWGRAAGDLATGLGEGVVSAGMFVPQLANTLTGGAVDKYAFKPLTGAIDSALGGTGEGNTLAQASQETREAMDQWKSPQLRQKEQELTDTKGFFPTIKKVITDPSLLAQQAVEQIPQLVAPGGIVRKAGAKAFERVAGSALAKGVEKRVAAGMAEDVATTAAKKAAERLGRRAAVKAGTKAAIATEALQSGSQNSEQAQQEVMSLDQKVLDANPDYQAMIARGVTPEQARETLAQQAGIRAGAASAALTAATGGLTGKLESKIFQGETGVAGLGKLFTGQGAKELGKAVGKETVQEALQEGGEQFGQNLGVQSVDPSKDLMDQVPESAAIGGVLGGVIGGGMFAGSAAVSRPRTAGEEPVATGDAASPVANPGAEPGSLSDAANVIHKATGPIGRAAEAAQVGGLRPNEAGAAAAGVPPVPNSTVAPAPAEAASPEQAAPTKVVEQTEPLLAAKHEWDAAVRAAVDRGEDPLLLAQAVAAKHGVSADDLLNTPDVSLAPEGEQQPSTPTAPIAPQPVNVPLPWVDQQTGEVGTPTKGQLTQALADYILQTYDTQGHMRINAGDLAGAWGVPKADISRVRNRATQMATQQVKAGRTAPQLDTGIPVSAGATDEVAAPSETGNPVSEQNQPPAEITSEATTGATDGNERAASPAVGEAATPGAEVASETDAEPAADADDGSAGAPAEPVAALPTAVAGGSSAADGNAAVATTPQSRETINEPQEASRAQEPDSLQGQPEAPSDGMDRTSGRDSGAGAVAGSTGAPAQAPQEEAAAPREGVPADDVPEPAPAVTATETPPTGGVSASGGIEAAPAVRIEAKGSQGIIVHGSKGELRTKMAAAGFKKPGLVVNGGLRFDAKDRGAIEAALALPGTPQQIDTAAHEAATSPHNDLPEPTQAQKEAGNYKVGRIEVHGLQVSVENPRGSTRSGVGENGKPWSHEMSDHYGYVRGTVGADGDHVDVYVGKHPASNRVYVVDQIDQKTGGFDEHKVMLGFRTKGAAMRAYRSNFDPGWKVGSVKDMTADEFKTWLKEGDTTKPLATGNKVKPVATAPAVKDSLITKASDSAPATGKDSLKVAAKPTMKRGGIATNGARVRVVGGKLEYVPGAKETLESYFKPGDVIKSYAGHDKVLGFNWNDGNWSVRVQEVNADGSAQVVIDHRNNVGEIRNHGTMPDKRELLAKLGKPVLAEKAPAKPVAIAAVAANTAPPTAAAAAMGVPEVAANPLDDFGERLEGARKFLPPSLKEALSDDVIASQPLSKFWPADAYQSIEDPAAAAFAFAARAAVPAKPRLAHKVKRWVEQVKMLRALLAQAHDARAMVAMDDMTRQSGHRLEGFWAKVRLLTQLPRKSWGRVDSVGEYPGAISYAGSTEDGVPKATPAPFATVTIDNKTHTFAGVGSIGPDEVQKVKDLLAGEVTKKGGGLTKADFEIRSYRQRGETFINRKGDAEKRPLKTFTGEDAVAQARAWRDDNVPALEAAWEKVKARDNVSKAETRREANRDRVGEDRRNGKDVTPEMFEQALGFRGVQFGNWVGQGKGAKDRQGLLNEAYDALLDLADLLGIPSKAISLNGSLGLALGARGTGRASAHFESSNMVINLTKTKGAGSLAHEWFHAMDNYFSRLRGGEVPFTGDQEAYRRSNYITYKPEPVWVEKATPTPRPRYQQLRTRLAYTSAALRRMLTDRGVWDVTKTLDENAEGSGWHRDPAHKQGVRPEVESAFAELVRALNDSPMAARATKLDGSKSGGDGYWHRIIERGARSFENYVISKLALRGQTNDFLANIRDWKNWAEAGKNESRYPYLRPEEEATVVAAFDKLFDTVQAREDESGNVALFRQTSDTASTAAPAAAQESHTAKIKQIATASMGKWKGDDVPNLRVVATPEQLPAAAKVAANGLPSTAYKTAAGMYDGRTIWIVASKHTTDVAGLRKLLTTMAHEGVGHYGVERIVERELGPDAWTKIEAATERLRADPTTASPAIQAVLARVEKDYQGASPRLFAQEFMAVSAERGVRNGLLDRAVTAIRRWLRRVMPDLNLSERELRQLLVASDQYLRVGESQQQRVQSRAAMAFSRDGWDGSLPDVVAAHTPGFLRNHPDYAAAKAGDAAAALRLARDAVTPAFVEQVRAALPVGSHPLIVPVVAREAAGDNEIPRMAAEVLAQRLGLGTDSSITQVDKVSRGGGDAMHRLANQPGFAGEVEIGRDYVLLDDTLTQGGTLAQLKTHIEREGGRVVLATALTSKDYSRTLSLQPDTLRKMRGRFGSIESWWKQQFGNGFEGLTESEARAALTFDKGRLSADGLRNRVLAGKIPEIGRVGAEAAGDRPGTDAPGSSGRVTDTPAFKRFFGNSKVVDAAGDPLPVFHGTADDFAAFDPNRSGSATAHMTAHLGTFFAEDQAKAQHYAENASAGVPAEERVVDAYLSIQKPYEMGLKEFQAIDSQDESATLRKKLIADGYDGIHLTDVGQWVAFEPTQIKSASENRGTFDPDNPNIYFSRSAESVDSLDEGQRVQQDTLLQRAKDWAAGKFEDLLPASLSLLQRRHLTELMAGQAPLRAATQYDETVQMLDADRAQLLAGAPDAAEHPDDMLKAGAAVVAEELREFTHEKGVAGWFGRKSQQGKDLAAVMHESTIKSVDPSKAYQRLQMKGQRGAWVDWTPQLVKERIALLKEVMMGRSGDDKTPMMDEIKTLRGLKYREKQRQLAYPALVAKYQALPPQGKALYKKMRDWYEQMSDATADALEARIMALRGDMEESQGKEIAERQTRMLVQKLRAEFEENKVTGVYFPLTRNGDYWVSYKNKAGDQGFQRFETAADQRQFLKDLGQKGGAQLATGRLDGDLKASDAPSGTFIADVIGSMKKAGATEKVQDEVYQTFLRTLPEVSMRKHAIHRKATPGYSEDITRAFAQNGYHGAHQLARLRWAHRLQTLVDRMQKNMDAARKLPGADAKKIARGDALLGELKRRHDAIMSPNDTQVANTLNGIGFLYYMGASPASAIVNLTQNAQVTLPVLGAHYGWGKASRALGAAMRDSMRTGGNIERTLKDEELRAYNTLRARGDIDKTQAHTMAGLAEGSLLQANPVYAKVMNGLTWMFHKAEVVNREAAGMAAYRLARARGSDFNTAVQYASEIINGTHFDYSAANRPRIMQGNTARVALQFKNYSASMTWMLYRNLYQSFKGESAEVRSVARKTLTGILGMTSLFAGVMGLPIINVVRAVAAAAHAASGDDDEPWDFNTEFRKWLAEHLGDDVANWVADGAVSQVTGASISSRVGIADLWFRDEDRALEGRDAFYNYLEGVAGPMAGLAKNVFIGTEQISKGHTWRGFETMMPKFAKDAMKATRYAHEGVNSLRGDPIMPDVSLAQELIQGLGFQPTALREQQRINSSLMNYTQLVRDRRTSLLNAYAMAWKEGDNAGTGTTMENIRAFNTKWPEIAISAGVIRASLRQRAKLSAQAENGIMLDRRIGSRIRQEVGATADQ